MRNLLIIILLSLCLGSCLPGHNDYSDYKQLPVDGWAYNDPVTFNIAGEDSIVEGTLSLGLRHTNAYPYSVLYLELAYEDTTGTTHLDTLNINMADNYGRWRGKGVGTDFQLVDTINTQFTRIKDAPVRLRHIMRIDTLRGIDMVGIEFLQNK